MRKALLGVVGALAFAGTAYAGYGIGGRSLTDPAVQQQVESNLNDFAAAWNRGDWRAMAASYRDDAVMITPEGRAAAGRPEIERLFQDEQTGTLRGSQFSGHLSNARQVAPGLVFADEEITISGARDPSGRAMPMMHLHGALLMSNQGGKWLVVDGRAYAFTPPPPMGVGGSGPDNVPPDVNQRPSDLMDTCGQGSMQHDCGVPPLPYDER